MNFLKRFRTTLIAVGIISILLIVGYYLPNSKNTNTDVQIKETVAQNLNVEIPLEENNPIKTSKEEKTVPTKKPEAPLATKEPIQAEEENKVLFCTLAVKCDTILNNIENISPEKIQLIPEDGVILPEIEIEFSEGDSAFDILKNELKKHGIHLEFNQVSMYDSVYIEGIGNIYEFDGGNLSGWLYRVNGKVPSIGCSLYEIKNGDKIEFLYTCNMGRDL